MYTGAAGERPQIAILAAEEHTDNCSFDQPALIDPTNYKLALTNAGAEPVILRTEAAPDTAEYEETVTYLLHKVDGIVFPGGPDVHPKNYGQEINTRYVNSIGSERQTAVRQAVFQEAIVNGTPVLGICLGMQLFNVFEGGELHQDLALSGAKNRTHRSESKKKPAYHPLIVDSREQDPYSLSAVLQPVTKVNSYHHQSISVLAPGYKVVATAPDGTIEAIENGDRWGVQWHAELDPEDLVIPAFVAICKARAQECSLVDADFPSQTLAQAA